MRMISEAHIQKIHLLLEANNRVDDFLNLAKSISEQLNYMYSRIIFSTPTEILGGDGGLDVSVILLKLEEINRNIDNSYQSAISFMSLDQTDATSKLRSEVEDEGIKIDDKLMAFKSLLECFKDCKNEVDIKTCKKWFNESGNMKYFKDIKTMSI